MMAAEGNNIVRYTYRGEEGEVIPRHATHIIVENTAAVRARAFRNHPNIEEVICHDGVETIEEHALENCPSLRRVIIPGVKVIERWAFSDCAALTYIEWDKLERIGDWAFVKCESLSNVDLPSIRIVQFRAFECCYSLKNAKFGKDLESIGGGIFHSCRSLERITIPLKDGLVADDGIFQQCVKFKNVDLVEGEILDETVAALLLEEWRNDMNEEIEKISQILRCADAGGWVIPYSGGCLDPGTKARKVGTWMRSVLRKIVHYKAEHQRILGEAAATLQSSLPNDILFKNVLPFLELPSHTFDGEN